MKYACIIMRFKQFGSVMQVKMFKIHAVHSIILVSLMMLPCFAQSEAGDSNHASASEEAAIKSQAQAYEKAFALGDAKTIADMWSEDGSFTDASGNQYSGRSAIQKLFAGYFANSGAQPIQIKVESIKFPTDDIAIEKGTCSLMQDGIPQSTTSYTAIHQKRNNQWKMVTVSEVNRAPAPLFLKDLGWLVGSWTVADPSSKNIVHLKVDWDKSHNFMHCVYDCDTAAGARRELQIIGWNPNINAVVSWHFSSTGGFGSGTWIRKGDLLVEEATGVQPDGATTTAHNLIRKIDDQSFTWRSVLRTLNQSPLPDTAEVVAKRDQSIN